MASCDGGRGIRGARRDLGRVRQGRPPESVEVSPVPVRLVVHPRGLAGFPYYHCFPSPDAGPTTEELRPTTEELRPTTLELFREMDELDREFEANGGEALFAEARQRADAAAAAWRAFDAAAAAWRP